ELDAATRHLELLRTQLDLARSPDAHRQATRALARLAIVRGDAVAALGLVQELFEVGHAPHTSRARTDCLAGHAALLAGGEASSDEAGMRLSRCAAGSPDARERTEARLL